MHVASQPWSRGAGSTFLPLVAPGSQKESSDGGPSGGGIVADGGNVAPAAIAGGEGAVPQSSKEDPGRAMVCRNANKGMA